MCCYDISQMDPVLRERFDVIFLFDVLEHIADEDRFLDALLFHMKRTGKLVINVPAGQWAFSAYDEAAGHVRRYSARTLRESMERSRLRTQEWSHWGLPLLPILMIRKLWFTAGRDQGKLFPEADSTLWTPSINKALGILSQCEWIPQKLFGTSLMAIMQRGLKEKFGPG